MLYIHTAGTLMEILIFNSPFIKKLGPFWIFDADDVRASGALKAVYHPGHICKWPVHFLFYVHISDR